MSDKAFILFSDYRFDSVWLRDRMRHYFNTNSRILIIAFAFYRDQESNSSEFLDKAGKKGIFTKRLLQQLSTLGISQEQVDILDFYNDSIYCMQRKIKCANTLIFSGGNCELTYERICALDLLHSIEDFNGLICGASAGALIQQKMYINYLEGNFVQRHGFGILPDQGWSLIVHNGIRLMGNHFDYGSLAKMFQTDLIMIGDEGAIIVDGETCQLFGDAKKINKNSD